MAINPFICPPQGRARPGRRSDFGLSRGRRLLSAVCLLVVLGAAQALAEELAGKYRGIVRGYDQELTITPLGGGRVKVEASVSIRGCAGDVEATGEVSAGRIIATAKPDYEDRLCRITITRKGARVSVDEKGCVPFHGASCEFAGTYQKQ